jgi:hypothetical protein
MYQAFRLKDHPEAARIIRAADPSYRKREFTLVTTGDPVELSSSSSDGCRTSEYTAVNLETLQTSQAAHHDRWSGMGMRPVPDCPKFTIPPGVAVVVTGRFCGQTSQARVMMHPDNIAKLLET